MPSARRLRLLLIVLLAIVVMTLVYTAQLRANEDVDSRTLGDFIHRTKEGLDKAHGGGGGQTVLDSKKDATPEDEEKRLSREMRERLKAAEIKAKDSANAKVLRPEKPEQVIGVGSSAGGQGGKDANDNAVSQETDEEHRVESTINEILKKSPVIIFSKTYCQYSKRAKGVLLEKYKISPEPYVVELDIHPMGKQIQDRLHEMTGRGTVPNIMINGKTIGGSDEILAMDKNNQLVDKIQSLGSVGEKSIQIKNSFIEKLN
ncbi:hypothetical protein N0V93_003877 [Gnomoniopsis smithogilvyi]|uniref:Glutaredoxin domain-containing protein n=1 Tax=Gnomoniopsis smithogilvyi TaxID=1191159 RepID=A0A9W8YZF3_9PEZI|nr:hypothetical protein N0V93_003877 [Gnomoniopsis smithogilvyi]